MVELKQGDILQAEAEALVNTVNTVGVMGRGIALQFRKAFPENFRKYEHACEHGQVRLGHMFLYETGRLTGPKYIINFPTKRHWKGHSRIEYIQDGLRDLVRVIREQKIRSIAIPPLGCGLGGLEWSEVRPLIVEAMQPLTGLRVLLYEPKGAPAPELMVKEKRRPQMTIGRAVLIELIRRYLAAVMDPAVSLLEIHKLMYFMQEAGQPLNLKFVKGTYGPYSKNLRRVLSHIEGHFITGYGDADDRPGRSIELLPTAIGEASKFLSEHPKSRERFEQVAALIKGFETPIGMELLSTVHWVVTREGATSEDEAIAKTYAWGQRKHAFSEKQIRIAWTILKHKGWLQTSGSTTAPSR